MVLVTIIQTDSGFRSQLLFDVNATPVDFIHQTDSYFQMMELIAVSFPGAELVSPEAFRTISSGVIENQRLNDGDIDDILLTVDDELDNIERRLNAILRSPSVEN